VHSGIRGIQPTLSTKGKNRGMLKRARGRKTLTHSKIIPNGGNCGTVGRGCSSRIEYEECINQRGGGMENWEKKKASEEGGDGESQN